MTKLWSPALAHDPLAFVLFAFPWGKAGTPLAMHKGPRKWQRKELIRIRDHIAKNKSAPIMQALRVAIKSGRGPGKSAFVSWMTLWLLSCVIGSTVIISANSENQLRSVTWGEMSRWLSLAINSHWFELSATKLVPAQWLTTLVERDLKKGTRYWGCEGKLWSSENPDSYAGVHNQDGMMVLFDESSGIDDPIWPVAGGYFTEPILHRYWMAFSNPRRLSGAFFECFNSKRDFWETSTVDCREVEGTDQSIYEQIIAEYGPDSYQARVEVYGEFPAADEEQFISPIVADAAQKRPLYDDPTAPVVIGVDPARSGADATVIVVRKGRDIVKIMRYRGEDTMTSVGRVIDAIDMYSPVLTVIDEGGLGYGVLDRLKEQRYNVRGVNMSWKPKNPAMYVNKRAEIWGSMRTWLDTAAIPKDALLKTDLTGVKATPTSSGAIQLEAKKDMRKRGLASPDSADALALTFAYPVAHRTHVDKPQRKVYNQREITTGWMAS